MWLGHSVLQTHFLVFLCFFFGAGKFCPAHGLNSSHKTLKVISVVYKYHLPTITKPPNDIRTRPSYKVNYKKLRNYSLDNYI